MTTTPTATTETIEWSKVLFTYPVKAKYTGKVQYRVNDAASVATPFGVVKRGEVREIRNRETANALVASGLFAHVDVDSPVGQPTEIKALDAAKKPAPAPADTPKTQEGSGVTQTQEPSTPVVPGQETKPTETKTEPATEPVPPVQP